MSTRLKRYPEEDDDSDEDNYDGTRYYTRYRYKSPEGIKYPKDSAYMIPDELLLDYVNHMNYTNFSTKKFELEVSKKNQRADYIEYDYFAPGIGIGIGIGINESIQKEPTVIYKLRGNDIIQSKIYEILKTASQDNIIKCRRPGYIYTSEWHYGSYSYDDLEALKYSGCGQNNIYYDGCAFY